MVKYLKIEKGSIKQGSVNDLKTKAVVWADYLSPTKSELKELSEHANISLEELREVLDEEERPRVMDFDDYSLIIFRAPFFENGDEISTTPIAIFLSKNKNNVITLRTREMRGVNRVMELMESQKILLLDKGISHFVYRLLDEILNTYFSVMNEIDEAIEKIEDQVVEKPDKHLVEKIFHIKKTLVYFHRSLTANREVITSIEKEYLHHISSRDVKTFRILYNDIVQLVDTESTYRDILTGTLDMYLSSVSNNLNVVIKKMTAMASFILIPTLISGIYGMNFQRIPELYWSYGYYFSLGLMVLSVIAMYSYFKRKGWL